MKTIYELQQIADRLRASTEVNSISPEDTFGLQADVLEYLADMEQNAEGLGIHQVYASYAAMLADASAPVGSNGKPLRFGQLVVIYDSSNTTQAESGNVYAWQKGQSGASAWKLMGNLGNVHALQSQIDSLLSSDESMKGKLTELDKKFTELEPKDNDKSDLDISDQNEYVLVRFKDGHIETKNFSSKDDALKNDAHDLFSVKDENGNPLMLINGGILVYPNGRIRTKSFDSAKTQYFVSKRNNQRCDIHKQSLRVLDIGNSHSWDCIRYLKDLVKESGIDVSDMAFVSLRRGGSNWKSWYDGWHDQDTESGDVLTGSTYYISKEFGGLDIVVKGNNLPEVTPITFQGNNAEEYRSLMQDNKFDLIIIHQNYLGLEHYDEWNGHGKFGYLPEFMRILHTTQPQAEIGTLINHAPFSQAGFSLFGTKEWLNNVVYQTDRKFIEEYGIRFIVPYGTALENIRQSHYNTSTHGLNYDLNTPIHSGLGLAVYTNSCAYFESLIAPRYGISVLGNSFRVVLTDEKKPGYKDASISVDNDDIAYTAQMAAILAINNMWEVQNPDNINI
ncbi:MAG: hypothetical protein SPF90_06125 [Bacteroidaceae bacterium]|nr:hypothetical protein [Bacteroidaceae bacterium]